MADTHKVFTTESKKQTKKSIYVDVDTILDTRLSVLYLLSDRIAQQVTEDGTYFTRIRENFGPISADIFQAFYDRRSKIVLKYAMPTKIIGLIQNYVEDLATDIKTIETDEEISLFINFYPYADLEEDEVMLIVNLMKKFVPEIEIKPIFMDRDELTPGWVIENVGCMFKYDNYRWLEYHGKTTKLFATPLLDVMYFTPAIVLGSDMEDKKMDKDFFIELEESMRMVIDYNILDISYFCMHIVEDEELKK